MKKLILFSSILFIALGFSQEVNQDSIYVVAEKMPEYPDGGIDGFRKFIIDNFQDIDNTEDIEGMIVSSFIIDTNGNLRNIDILRDLGSGIAEELTRILNLTPKWIPGQIGDVNVNVKYTFPIRIKMKAKVISDTENSFKMNPNGTYTLVEIMPEYPDGGIEGFRRFIMNNYRVPKAYENLQGIVLIQFIVDEQGNVTNVKSIRDLGYGTGKEAVRIIKKSKKWIPGSLNGKPVKVTYTLPINMNIRSSGVMGTLPKMDYNPPLHQF